MILQIVCSVKKISVKRYNTIYKRSDLEISLVKLLVNKISDKKLAFCSRNCKDIIHWGYFSMFEAELELLHLVLWTEVSANLSMQQHLCTCMFNNLYRHTCMLIFQFTDNCLFTDQKFWQKTLQGNLFMKFILFR